MGSKSSKWLAATFVAAALAVAPAGAFAKLDYSRNSVDGHYLPSPSLVVPQANDISVPGLGAPVAAPVNVAQRIAAPDSGFSWADAFAGAGAALLLAFGAGGIVRRRHAPPLAS